MHTYLMPAGQYKVLARFVGATQNQAFADSAVERLFLNDDGVSGVSDKLINRKRLQYIPEVQSLTRPVSNQSTEQGNYSFQDDDNTSDLGDSMVSLIDSAWDWHYVQKDKTYKEKSDADAQIIRWTRREASDLTAMV